MLPSAAELEYFLEVASSLNLSRASERLGMSQPSLSLAIKRLEQSVGTHLFIRHQHGVTLTQAGKQLLLHTRQLLQDWENTRSQALASHQEVQGYFTIGCPATMAIHSLSGFLPTLLENNPKLEIQLKHDVSRRIMEQVISLSIDIGIVANPIKHPDLIIIKLCDDDVTFWVGPGTRKIQNTHSKEAIILCDPDLTQTQSLLKTKKNNISHSRMIKINSLEVIANLTAKGCGIGILPTRVVQSMYPDKLKRIPKAPVYRDQLCLIYRNENRNIHAIQVMTNAIKSYFKSV
jgi:DNA-binding transcriptional LysR family regulator